MGDMAEYMANYMADRVRPFQQSLLCHGGSAALEDERRILTCPCAFGGGIACSFVCLAAAGERPSRGSCCIANGLQGHTLDWHSS